jgi:hypothetical protein
MEGKLRRRRRRKFVNFNLTRDDSLEYFVYSMKYPHLALALIIIILFED